MPFRIGPDGDLIWVAPGPSADFDEDGEAPISLTDLEELLEDKVNDALASTSQSISNSTNISQRKSTSFSITEQISRRFFDVPTPEKFLDDFEVAYGGFLDGLREKGLGPDSIGLALDPVSGIMDLLMDEYMGGLAAKAAAGEDIFSLVGTEEDFKLLRTEPGNESIRRDTDSSVETTQGSSTGSTSSSTGSSSTSKGSTSGKSTSEGTGTSIVKGKTEVLSRPEIASVFKFSPTDFLEERFHGDAGELSTFIESRKGEQSRRRQTLAGGPVITARRT